MEEETEEDVELTAGTGMGYPSLPNRTLGFCLEEALEEEALEAVLVFLEGFLGFLAGILGT